MYDFCKETMTGTSGIITGVCVAHDHATVDEITTAGAEKQCEDVRRLLRKSGVREAFALHTCNRTEAYVVTNDPEMGKNALRDIAPNVRDTAVRYLDHDQSLEHLLRVAAGLESMVVGEDQILGQVRDAYEEAQNAGGIGPMFEQAVTKAIHVGERARAETKINDGIVSVGSAAAKFASEEVKLTEATATVVGAGDMAELTAKALEVRGINELKLTNRTPERAEDLARHLEVSCNIIPLSAITSHLPETDIVITSTASSEPLLTDTEFADAGQTIVIDIAQPRDVKPSVDKYEHVTVYDLDALESVTEATQEQRQAAANKVETIVDDELDQLLEQFKRKRADQVIQAMYEGAEEIKEEELQNAIQQAETAGELTDDQKQALEAMADALMNRLLAAPTKSLRDAAAEDDWNTIHTAIELFNPNWDGNNPPQGHKSMSRGHHSGTNASSAEFPHGQYHPSKQGD